MFIGLIENYRRHGRHSLETYKSVIQELVKLNVPTAKRREGNIPVHSFYSTIGYAGKGELVWASVFYFQVMYGMVLVFCNTYKTYSIHMHRRQNWLHILHPLENIYKIQKLKIKQLCTLYGYTL